VNTARHTRALDLDLHTLSPWGALDEGPLWLPGFCYSQVSKKF
jgi:hypothetical protein